MTTYHFKSIDELAQGFKREEQLAKRNAYDEPKRKILPFSVLAKKYNPLLKKAFKDLGYEKSN